MRRSFTAVIEKNATFTADFETEPYEAAWASEARWFIRVLELSTYVVEYREGSDPAAARHLTLHHGLETSAQISPDGLFWCDEGTHETISEPGLYSFKLRDFGGWLRLRCAFTGGDGPRAKLMIYLVLKE